MTEELFVRASVPSAATVLADRIVRTSNVAQLEGGLVVGAFQRFAAVANSVVQPLVLSPRWGRLLEGQMTVITYTGRRSGRTFTTPVAYKRHGDELSIGVQFPDQKKWWRNFLDGGGPISLRLRGVERNGKATAVRDSRGKVTVSIVLEPET